MGRTNWLTIIIIVAVLVFALGTTAVFAQGSTEQDGQTGNFWKTMHEACENRDYETMADLHDQYHDEYGEMICDWNGQGSIMDGNHMGGGMMGGFNHGGGMMGGW
jgi:hypothetical protein